MLEGIAGLGINLPALLWQIINFSLLLTLLYFFLYKPLLRVMEQRSQRIKEGLEAAERSKQEAMKAEQQIRAQLEAARKEGQNIISQSIKIGERLEQEARERANKEAEELISRAREEIQREREEALTVLRKEFAELTIQAAEKILRRSLNKEDHRRLIEETLKEIK